MEYKLLVALVKHAGMVMTHRHLLEEVWGESTSETAASLEVIVARLRRKRRLLESSYRPN